MVMAMVMAIMAIRKRKINKFMIDIHCHILPNVDDGSKSLDETRDLLYMAKSEGISDVVITPHFSKPDGFIVNADTLNTLFEELKNNCKDIGVNLYLGNELMIDKSLDDLLTDSKILSLNGSRYVLVEFPFGGYKREFDDYLMNIALSGYKIIIAHPERYKWAVDNPDNYIDRWIDNGYFIQCNNGFVDNSIQRKFVFKLIENQKIHFIASDAHNKNRPLSLEEAYKLIAKKFDEEVSKVLFIENPSRLLENKEIINIKKIKRHLF